MENAETQEERDMERATGSRRSKGAASTVRARFGRIGVLAVVGAVAALLVADAAAQQSAVDPRSPNARSIADLWWILFWLGTAVFIVVMLLVLVAVVRRRHEEQGHRFVVGAGAVIPFFILAVVFGATLMTMRALADRDEEDALRIHIVGHQFWWEVRYPDADFVTANEINIPAGEDVRLDITTDDVIHSLWVPELSGKLDLIPGKTNTLWLHADEPGSYRGQCAEFCGIQHANMAFLVVARAPEDFAGWLEGQQQLANVPSSDVVKRGQEVFLSSACVYCHAVRGTNASGELGPDLTHLASRQTLAAGTLENNRGNLAGWIVDPQAIKPGNLMPGVDLSSEELQALLSYLESLE